VAGEAGTVEVAATIAATAMTNERAAELIREAKVDETVAPDRVAIAAEFPRRGGNLEMSFKVTVPPDADVEATLSNNREGRRFAGHIRPWW
jgi:hypothetical protein